MIKVARPQGFVVLFHVESEGKKNSYNQLHKWDFTRENGDFVIGGQNRKLVNVSKMFVSAGDFECALADGNILVAIRKKQ
jgi:hypothetical protein